MTRQSAEHHCDGVWIDLDAVLDAAGVDQLNEAALVAASVGAAGLIGDGDALRRTRVPQSLGTLLRGIPEERAPWDLVLADAPSTIDEASAWSSRTGGQLVLSENALSSLDADRLDRLGGAGLVAAIWCGGTEGEALELTRSFEGWTGFHGGLEFAAAYRAGAGALAGPIPLLHPALGMALHELCRDDVEQAHTAERRLARWLEASVLPACRTLGLERPELGRAAIEIGGWLRTGDTLPGEQKLELRHQLIELSVSLGLDPVARLMSEAS